MLPQLPPTTTSSRSLVPNSPCVPPFPRPLSAAPQRRSCPLRRSWQPCSPPTSPPSPRRRTGLAAVASLCTYSRRNRCPRVRCLPPRRQHDSRRRPFGVLSRIVAGRLAPRMLTSAAGWPFHRCLPPPDPTLVQVPLLVRMKELPRALAKAVEASDTDLVQLVLLHANAALPSTDCFDLVIPHAPAQVRAAKPGEYQEAQGLARPRLFRDVRNTCCATHDARRVTRDP